MPSEGEPVSDNLVPTVIPGWLAPGVVTLLTPWTYRDVSVPAGAVTLILDNDPERVAFGVCQGGFGVATLTIAPWSDTDAFPVLGIGANRLTLFGLQEYLSLVTSQWYAKCTGDITIRIVEWKTPTLGG